MFTATKPEFGVPLSDTTRYTKTRPRSKLVGDLGNSADVPEGRCDDQAVLLPRNLVWHLRLR
jgi:hypothetical protein